jgi:hypothetical protein
MEKTLIFIPKPLVAPERYQILTNIALKKEDKNNKL